MTSRRSRGRCRIERREMMAGVSHDNPSETDSRSHHRSIRRSGPAPGATRGPRAFTVDRGRRGLGQQTVSFGRGPCGTPTSSRGFGSPHRAGAAVASPAFAAIAFASSRAAPCGPSGLRVPVVVVRRPLVSRPKCAAYATAGRCYDGDDGRRSGSISSRAPPTRAGRRSTQPVARCTPCGSCTDCAGDLQQLDGLVDRGAVLGLWERALSTPPWSGPPLWIHGDLHPGNLLVSGGRLSAVIDFGDLAAGDPATDLSVFWMLLPPSARQTFLTSAREEFDPLDDHTLMRARGWALALGLAYLANSRDDEAMSALGRATIDNALSDNP